MRVWVLGQEKMKYKYNIKHKEKTRTKTINFKSKNSMLKYLDKNKDKLNQLQGVALHFGPIVLPLAQTMWHVKQLTERQQQKLQEKQRLQTFVSKLEK